MTTEQTIAALMPCPFCGATPLANNNPNDLYVSRYGTHYHHPPGICYLADAEISPSEIDDWNTRAALHEALAPPADVAAPKVTLGPVALEFTSFQEWVNKAQNWFSTLAATNPNAARKRYLSLDMAGRVCMIGSDFMRARDEDKFPVRVYFIDAARPAADGEVKETT